ncbi:Beta-hexosaminidase subunit beta [Halotydeus destructor]|nr:Beta-hexosaminidase subunit beta [Halotydeus destructor]
MSKMKSNISTKRLQICFQILVIWTWPTARSQSGDDSPEPSDQSCPVWPMPQYFWTTGATVPVDPLDFRFVIGNDNLQECDILVKAIERYKVVTFIHDCAQVDRKSEIFNPVSNFSDEGVSSNQETDQAKLQTLVITIENGGCETYPDMSTNETYTLDINEDQEAQLTANSVWGALRGLETFSQLVDCDADQCRVKVSTTIDYPRFSYRGVLLDTGRHFVPVDTLVRNLEAMEYNKMNVFHWHIVDHQSFPYVSKAFPKLSQNGAYSANHVYRPEDVARVLELARLRGIRVLVEFDTPGHMASWGKGVEGLLIDCQDSNSIQESKNTGVKVKLIDPTKETTYDFLEQFFAEVVSIFPEQLLHLGGDEAVLDCWHSDANVTAFRKAKDLTVHQLEERYISRLLNLVNELNRTAILWQEQFDNGHVLNDDVIIHVWKNDWQSVMSKVTKRGHRAILSSRYYLNYIKYGEIGSNTIMLTLATFMAPKNRKNRFWAVR